MAVVKGKIFFKVKTNYFYSQLNYSLPRTAIEREQKQFIKIAFAVHLSAVISAERYRSDSGALKSAVPVFVYLCIVLIVHKYRQSAKRKLLLDSPTDRTFENRWSRYKELGKKVPQAYRVYVEDTFLPCDAVIARIFSKEMTHTDNHGDNEEQKAKRYYYHSDHLGSAQFVTDWKGRQYEHIEYTPYGELWIEEVAAGLDKLPFRFTGKELDEETGLYYYGARYLDPKYSRWLSGDPALGEYIPQAPVNDEAKKHNENLPGMGGVFNVVNLHVYHYAGNNPVKYVDPDGRDIETVKETIRISIDLGKQVAPLFEEPNPNNLMSEAKAMNKANAIKGLLTNMADIAKKDPDTFVKTLVLGGLCGGIAFGSGLVDSIIDLNNGLKEKGIDIMGMNLSGSMNLSSSVNLKYSAQFQPNLGSSFNLGINLNGNLNKTIGDKHSLSFGISAGFTIPSNLMPTMKFSFLYKVQL